MVWGETPSEHATRHVRDCYHSFLNSEPCVHRVFYFIRGKGNGTMSILNLSDLESHPTRTKQHEISISLLANYYETYLHPNYYDFELNNGVTVRIDFHKEHFCHLVGIDQISTAKFKNPNDTRLFMYRGKNGFRRSKNGKYEFNHLRALHQYEFNKQKDKMFFFHFIHTMLDSVNLTLVNYTIISGSTIRCDFMFYDTYDNALLHLGVEKIGKPVIFSQRHSSYVI